MNGRMICLQQPGNLQYPVKVTGSWLSDKPTAVQLFVTTLSRFMVAQTKKESHHTHAINKTFRASQTTKHSIIQPIKTLHVTKKKPVLSTNLHGPSDPRARKSSPSYSVTVTQICMINAEAIIFTTI